VEVIKNGLKYPGEVGYVSGTTDVSSVKLLEVK
jgi:hypothetical protein